MPDKSHITALKVRLATLNFLGFAVWGCYLTCIAQYLGPAGMGREIGLFYAMQGIVSIFMPALMGIVADKWIPSQRLLAICHFLAAAFMTLCWAYGHTHAIPDFGIFFTLYSLSVAFYMPTIALANSTSFNLIKQSGLDPVGTFPPIRVLGTVGFIAAMWFVNSFFYHDGIAGFTLSDANPASVYRFQYTDMQLLSSAVIGFVLAVYCLTLPKCPVCKTATKNKSLTQMLGLDAFRLFGTRAMAMFLIFAMLLGISLQITNGYATPFITSFKAIPEYLDTFGANNATLLTSLSQISEACCILLIPFFLRRFGIKRVMLMAMMAWVLRFGLFGAGNPGTGVWMLILSMIVYGVAFDFFNVSGALYVEQQAPTQMKSSAQGLFMLMTNGIGASVGMLAAGAVVDHFCTWQDTYLIGDWRTVWYLFAAFALVVFVAFAILFPYKKTVKTDASDLAQIEGSMTDV